MSRMGRPPVSPEIRFFPRVTEDGDCWVWTGSVDRCGYGYFWNGERQVKAHRWSYEFLRAEIPAGLVLDHLCRRPECVNPWHLEPVTVLVNTLRGTSTPARNAAKSTCDYGHPFDIVSGRRRCRVCASAANRRHKSRRAA